MIIIFYIFITFCQYECLGQPKSRRKVWILILPRHPSLSAFHIRSCARGSFRAIRKSRASSDLLEQNLPPKSPKYIGYIILHHHHILDGWAQLHEAVKTGRPIEKRSYGEEFERECFLMGMFNLAMGIAPNVSSSNFRIMCSQIINQRF